MRIEELCIQNIRGICDLRLTPEGKNLVIWGANGSGKSAVVDAIDFLLTGRISRLTGKGTGDIKLDIHGAHIDHKPEEAVVSAKVSVSGYKKPIEITRCIANPDRLLYSDPKEEPYLAPILAVASRGQHVLTRREILKFITSEPGDRAQGIQALLDLRDIEEIRKTLVRVQTTCQREFDSAMTALATAAGEVNAITGEKTYGAPATLDFVNAKRKILTAQPITKLDSTQIKIGLTPPVSIPGEKTANTVQLESDNGALVRFQAEQNVATLVKADEELRKQIASIRSDPDLLRSLKRLQLIQLGIELADEGGACPLCDTPWPPGKLRQYLDDHLSQGKTALAYRNNINEKARTLLESFTSVVPRIRNVMLAAEALGMTHERDTLSQWAADLQRFINRLSNPIDQYETADSGTITLGKALTLPGSEPTLGRIQAAARSKFPGTTPELDAWDTLTKLETRISSYEKAGALCLQKRTTAQRSVALYENFIAARNSVLQALYDSVRDRFVSLYRQIHGSDESGFTAIIRPEEAGLDFKVDFYGHGEHPPHAMHSEGHQDSMGLCLYLALAERLTEGILDLIILDDVVMSVDADHRRYICDLLSKSFPTNQFVITTHDRTWANQLRSTKVVDSKGMVHFYNWHVAAGPQVDYEADIWGRIEQDLAKDDVSSAAAKLRQNSEQYFAMACDALEAPVIFKLNGTYDLGNLLDGAIRQYNALLGKANATAQSWGNRKRHEELVEFEKATKSAYTRTNAERWPLNPTIHYTNWENLTSTDFRPVVAAFKDLYAVFACRKCGGMLRVTTTGAKQEAVRCDCLQVDWNLVAKDKAQAK